MALALIGGFLAYCFYVSIHYGRPSQDAEFAEQERQAREARMRLAERDDHADRLSLDEVRFYAHHSPTRQLPDISQPWWVPTSKN